MKLRLSRSFLCKRFIELIQTLKEELVEEDLDFYDIKKLMKKYINNLYKFSN